MLLLNQNVLDTLVSAAEGTLEECCGFLFGHDTGEQRIITNVMRVDNASGGDKCRSFEISPKDYRNAETFADDHSLQLLGVYHSHPNHPPIPSEYDRVAAQPYFSYIILSIMNKKFDTIRSWNLSSDFNFKEESLAITQIN